MSQAPAQNSDQDCKIIFSRKIQSGNRTYFIDLRKTIKEELLLVINESRRIITTKENRQKGFIKKRIIISQRDLHKFSDGINLLFDFIEKNF